MKKISENLIKPMEDADILKGRINRKLIQNIFFIDIDRPSKMNGFTPFMFKEMAKAFTEYENNNNALCAIVYSSGDNFCAGMDLKEMSTLKASLLSNLRPVNKYFIALLQPARSTNLMVAPPVINNPLLTSSIAKVVFLSAIAISAASISSRP